MSGKPPRARAARWGWVLIAILVGGAVVLLRVRQLDQRRDEASAQTVKAIARAVSADDRQFDREIGEAHDRAEEALRESSALVDPWPAFLLTIVEELRKARGERGPADPDWSHQPVRVRFVWHLAHGQLDQAEVVLSRARDLGARDEALPLYQRLLDGVRSQVKSE